MDTLREISVSIIWLIRIGVVLRVVQSFFNMIYEEDGAPYKRRIKNSLRFYVLAESIFQLKDIAIYYFKYGGKGGPF